MESDDATEDETCLPRKYVFTLDLKTPKLYRSGKTDAGNEFHSFAVRLINVEAKRFVRIGVSCKPELPPPQVPEPVLTSSETKECCKSVSAKPGIFRPFTKPELPPPLNNDCKIIVKQKFEKSVIKPEISGICSEICSKCKKKLEGSSHTTNDEGKQKTDSTGADWRRQCGCLKTSEKLKELLKRFPAPPPPPSTPSVKPPELQTAPQTDTCAATCASALGASPPIQSAQKPTRSVELLEHQSVYIVQKPTERLESRSWRLLSELVQILQLSVTATALALYYVIYIYMQMVYFTLRSAVYFHHADGPMRITIAVVTLTSLVVLFNVVVRLEKLVGFGR